VRRRRHDVHVEPRHAAQQEPAQGPRPVVPAVDDELRPAHSGPPRKLFATKRFSLRLCATHAARRHASRRAAAWMIPGTATLISRCSMKCTTILRRRGGGVVLYQAYQAHCDMMEPVRVLADVLAKAAGCPFPGLPDHPVLRNLTAAYELIARAGLTHERPPFDVTSVMVGNREVAVSEEAVPVPPRAPPLRFRKDIAAPQPRVLLVAPL